MLLYSSLYRARRDNNTVALSLAESVPVDWVQITSILGVDPRFTLYRIQRIRGPTRGPTVYSN